MRNRQNTMQHRQNTMQHRQNTVQHRQNTVQHRQNTVQHRQNTMQHRQNTVLDFPTGICCDPPCSLGGRVVRRNDSRIRRRLKCLSLSGFLSGKGAITWS